MTVTTAGSSTAAATTWAGERPGWLELWARGLVMGLRVLPREPILGLKRIALPVSYWRTAEFAYVWSRLGGEPGIRRVLDLGSPKEFAIHLAGRFGYDIVSVDIMPDEIDVCQRLAAATGLTRRRGGSVVAEVGDGRALPYPDDSFDAAFTVSVLEHIPGEGDSRALAELVRVVRPGGLVAATVPFAPEYRETHVHAPVYERDYDGVAPVFFERHYDRHALERRLLDVPADVVDLELWGEGRVRCERLLGALGPLRALASPLEPALAGAFLRPADNSGPGVHPMAAFLTLRKPNRAPET
ncbi:MAG TPA: class I SAM-dependent methyltransferase [Longimicrobiales bacterium]|nr:class I SAM-dependent methyltransferase [Longimicrobiales bacterium]